MKYSGRSPLYNHIADNIGRYKRAISYYETEIGRTVSREEKLFYQARIDSAKEEVLEMEDVIKFLDERYLKRNDKSS